MRLSKNDGEKPVELKQVSWMRDRLPLSTPILAMGKPDVTQNDKSLSSSFFSRPTGYSRITRLKRLFPTWIR